MYLHRIVLLASFLFALQAWAQVPTKCLEIESILVDACNPSDLCPGSSEGQNEMVRFRTGPQSTAITDIEADWPNNSWRGLEQNALTAQVTAELNATIESCGWLLEPPQGIIPPGSPVLMVTSSAMCTAANSFASLGDTLYIVFQAAGNTAGHFANQNNGNTEVPSPTGGESLRTLILTYLPTSCSDSATYDRQQLVNVNGLYGGTSAINDGATAEFSWPGVPVATYVNTGCQAPVIPLSVAIEQVSGSLCDGGTVTLSAITQGDLTQLQWSGGSGTFSDPGSATTTYTPGPADVGDVVLQVCGQGPCADPVCASITLPTGNAPVVSITANGPLAICPGQDLVLSASGADSYVWSTQETTTSITITQPGNYSVVGTGACGSATASVVVASSPGPTVAISGDLAICAGGSTQLTATGADSYVWSTQATTASIVVTQPGTYSVVGTNACGTANASVNVTLLPGPVAGITGNTTICPGATTVLTATGGPSYLWSNGVTTASITVGTAGTYSVTVDNGCGTDVAEVVVTAVDVDAAFTSSVTSGTAPLPVSFQSQSTPAGVDHAWTFGDGQGSGATSPSHTYMEPGVYQVVLTVSASGCLVTAQTTITVLGEPVEASELTVPNVFTPNGDGQNDQFGLIQVGITTVDMEIMNRWGQLVGRIERVGQEWDGRSPAGENVPDGTYFYVLKANGDDGKRYDLSGTITLLR